MNIKGTRQDGATLRSSFLLLLPLCWFTLWHGWLLPLPRWHPPEHAILAKEERFYRATDPTGYLRFIEVTRAFKVPILRLDQNAAWYQVLPQQYHDAGMFVYDGTIWLNTWNQETSDPGYTLSVIEHELTHVLCRQQPDYFLRVEGVVCPPFSPTDWRVGMEQEIVAANVQLRVAKRLGSAAGIDFALYVARIHFEDMGQERRQRFLESYATWLLPELTAQAPVSGLRSLATPSP